jgi:hypothetical protein
MSGLSWCAALVGLSTFAQVMAAQTTDGAASFVGTWRGVSVCQVRPSSCNDETVVYRITRMTARDSIAVDARKIIDAREQEMGVLTCQVDARGAVFTCTLPNGLWRFTARGDSLLGELRLTDGTRYRDVRTARSAEGRR